MNCRDFEMNVRALVRNELMDAARRDGILKHAAHCFQCSDRLAGEQALIAGVRAVVAKLAEQKAPAQVRSAVLNAFREQTLAAAGNTVVAMPLLRTSKVVRHWRLEAAAAAILVSVSMAAVLWIYYSPGERQSATIAPAAPVIGAEPSRPSNPVAASAAANVAGPPPSVPSRPRHRAARQHTRAKEEVTEFFPLMEGIDLDSLEAVQAVRVELPASALNDLGLQPGREAPSGAVKADVLLGIDGLARAIRFVR